MGKHVLRQPRANVSSTIAFIMRGAEKRRTIAYKRAKVLQRELGVVPTVQSIK